MGRKKLIEAELFEDEKVIPAEENNCFAFKKKCTILLAQKMSRKDQINCGTMRCPFYKPEEHKESVKRIDEDGNIYFQSFEEYEKESGRKLLKVENLGDYEGLPHAEEDINELFKYMDQTESLKDFSIKELRPYAEHKGIDTTGMTKKDIIDRLSA